MPPTVPPAPPSRLRGMTCSECAAPVGPEHVTACSCGAPMLCDYDLAGLARWPPPRPRDGRGVFRWAELLPVLDPARRLSLGEGDTPVVSLPRVAAELGLASLEVKDESGQPCGSFKARGLAVSVAAHAERGATAITIPTAGNAGGAAAAYARRHGLECRVVLPSAATATFRLEARLAGARSVAVNGDIGAAGDWVREHPGPPTDHALSTFREPFRVEGKKTMAYELWESFGEDLPDMLVYPTGGGVGLVAIHRAFAELRAAGLMRRGCPRLVAAQIETCAPVVRALDAGADSVEAWGSTRRTLAEGLRVPRLAGGRLVLRALRDSDGFAQAVSEPRLLAALRLAARLDGVLLGPEGAVALAAVQVLAETDRLRGARVLVFNTGSLYKSPEALQAAGLG